MVHPNGRDYSAALRPIFDMDAQSLMSGVLAPTPQPSFKSALGTEQPSLLTVDVDRMNDLRDLI
jgi:hypothetical protein